MSEAVAPAAPANDLLTRPWYRWYVLAVLFVVYVFNFIDRSILGILNEAIKNDLGTSDTQMGFLGGIAFAVFYTLVGIPVARLADRAVRRNVLATCLAIWSVMTALCGLATSFTQLLLARIGVAVGEAGGSPPSHSMISDFFPPSSRATALAVYALGIPAGGMIGSLAGGWINATFNWQTAFLVVGLPGVVLAVFVRFFIAEPRRGMSEPPRAPSAASKDPTRAHGVENDEPAMPSIKEVISYLWDRKSFRYLCLAGACHAFVGYGVGYWVPAFFIRIHHVDTATLGLWLFWLGVPAMISTFFGGWLGDLMGKRDVRWYLWLPAVATVLAMPFNFFVYLWDDYRVALLVSILPGLIASFWLAPTFALTQGLVTLRMRAMAASIMLFVINLIGLGLGPQLTGILSDVLNTFTDLGVDSLRWSLIIVSFVALGAAQFYLMAARTLKDDLARAAVG